LEQGELFDRLTEQNTENTDKISLDDAIKLIEESERVGEIFREVNSLDLSS